MNEIEVIKAAPEVPSGVGSYIDTHDLDKLYDKIAFTGSHILVGPKGVGKSLSVHAFAERVQCPLISVDCSEDLRRSALVGNFILKGNSTPFVLGAAPLAFEAANDTGQAILLLEEINSCTPQFQKSLNPLCDFRCKVEVPEISTVYKLRKGAKLWVVGTMNSSAYGGVYALNEDLKSRFRMLPLGYPNSEMEAKIVSAAAPNFSAKLLKSLLTLAKETRQGQMGYALSPRDLCQIAVDIELVGVDKALWMAMGKFEETDAAAFKKRCEAVFPNVSFV